VTNGRRYGYKSGRSDGRRVKEGGTIGLLVLSTDQEMIRARNEI
jgi:hypothetical protein